MDSLKLPEECSRQWEIILLLIGSEEKKINRTKETEVETMTYFLNNEGIKQILLQWLRQMQSTYGRKLSDTDTALKCDHISTYWRLRGNEYYKRNYMYESYEFYCKSVLYAQPKGTMYALALANRSAALHKMKRYKDSLRDIEMALAYDYPKEMRFKLIIRQADCLIALNRRLEAAEAMNEVVEQVKELKIIAAQNDNIVGRVTVDQRLDAEVNASMRQLQHKMRILKAKPEEVDTELDTVDLPLLHNGDNPRFVSASRAVELRRSNIMGRMVVTVEPIKRGDVLFSEEPYAWVPILGDKAVCDGCSDTEINSVPCATCSRVVYCEEECRERAFIYHQHECVGAQAKVFATIGIAHLALRVLLKAAIDGFPKLPPNMPTPKTASDLFAGYSSVDDIDIYKAETPAFFRMFNLVTNFAKMNRLDYAQYAVTAVMLTLYLEHFTCFFEFLHSRLPYRMGATQLRIFAASLMLRALGQLVCNGHAALTFVTVDNGDDNTVSEREVRRATAIYPSAAMMNHNCDPNIINNFYKSRLIVRGSRDLSRNTQVYNCYGPHRSRDTTAKRQRQLRAQYSFTCRCTACLDSKKKNFVLYFSAYACQSCKSPVECMSRRAQCSHCNAPFDLTSAVATLDEADSLQTRAESARSLPEQIEKRIVALRVRQKVLYRHHVALRPLIDTIARLYAENGEINKSLEFIKQNVQSLEYQFGPSSVEVAHELRKLSDLMVVRMNRALSNPEYSLQIRDWCLEGHKIVKKAFLLMELNFGSWEPHVKKLKEQEVLMATYVERTRATNAEEDDVHENLHYNLKI